ncbi:MAG: hypothetical protein DIU68_002620 [Chloroflexota bacterium]
MAASDFPFRALARATPGRLLAAILPAVFALAACASPDNPTGWPVETVAHAPQIDAPAVWFAGSAPVAHWIGSDNTGIHHDTRKLEAEITEAPVVLPLPPTHPYSVQAVEGSAGGHVFWLDRGDDGNRLYTALITAGLEVRRGPTTVSDRPAFHYDAVSDGRGGAWALWTGGLAAEPALYLQPVDVEGRPLQARQIALNAMWPAIARSADDMLHLFWLDRETGDLWHASADQSGVGQSRRLSGGILLAPGDRIASAQAAVAGTTAYLLLNITRADGSDESWLTSGSTGAQLWNRPARLEYEAEALRWAAIASHGDTAALAGVAGSEIWLYPLSARGIDAGQMVAVLARDLLAPLRLYADTNGRWLVVWSEPNDNASADLKVAREPATS